MVFLEAADPDCGICDIRLKLCADGDLSLNPSDLANEFFAFECHQVDKMTGYPVKGSTGIAAMGQVNHLGTGVYNYFFGDYKLEEYDNPLTNLFKDNYYMNFKANEHSLFTRDIYASFEADEILFSATAMEGIPSDWLDDDKFVCSYYIGDQQFDPTTFDRNVLNNVDLVSFYECFTQDDMMAYV